MKITYYIYGSRPIIEHAEPDYEIYYAFNWQTGKFDEDITYSTKIWSDPSGDARKVSKAEFDQYVQQLKEERGLL